MRIYTLIYGHTRLRARGTEFIFHRWEMNETGITVIGKEVETNRLVSYPLEKIEKDGK